MIHANKYFVNENINISVCRSSETDYHSHDFIELSYVESGKAVHKLNGKKTIIQKGNYFILDYNSTHSYRQYGDEPLVIINCLFMPEFIDKTLYKCRGFNDVVNNYSFKFSNSVINISPANSVYMDDNGSVRSLLHTMYNEYEKRQSGFLEIIRCRLIEAIIITMRKTEFAKNLTQNSVCKSITKFAESHITDKDILSKASEKTNFSVSYLSSVFKKEMGLTFSKYIQVKRMEEACRLLANTDKKIIEIAQLVGYTDMKFFNSLFKANLGITPREFRKRYTAI